MSGKEKSGAGASKFQIGAEAIWLRTARGGYGYTQPIPVVIVDLSEGRAKVEARTITGNTKQVWVRKYNLILKAVTAQPLTKAERFTGAYPDSFAA
jgi:hypothetical protein